MPGDIAAFGADDVGGAVGKTFDAAGIGHIDSLCQVETHANTDDDKLRWLFSARRCLQAFQRLDGLIHVDLVLGEGMGGVLESGDGQHAQRLHGLRLVFGLRANAVHQQAD